MPSISIQDLTAGEGEGFVDVVVRLSEAATGAVSVKYATADWIARGDRDTNYDYRITSGTLTFAAGETSKSVRILLNGSARGENDGAYDQQPERFKLVLSDPSNATLAGEGYAWITLISNDTLRDNPELHVRDLVVDEAAGQARFTVTLGRLDGQAANNPVTVRYATVDGSAQAGSDYTATGGMLTFQPGESVKTVSVPLLNDGVAEADEQFSLVLSDPTTGVIVRGRADGTIGANDTAATARPRIAAGELTVGEGERFADVVVTLSAPGTSRVTVKYATETWIARGDRDTNYDYTNLSGTLSFEPGETTKVVRIDLNDAARGENDGNYDQQPERFKFVLSDPSNATLAGEGYAWITLISNDTVLDNPELHVRDLVVDEAAGLARFIVTLGRLDGQAANNPVTVRYATADGSAQAGSDYTATSGTLTFLPGESVKTVTVPLLNDSVAEGAEQFSLVLSEPTTGVIVRGRADVTIGANGAVAVPQPRIAVGELVVGEGDRFADVVVSLSAPGTSRVTVKYATADWIARGDRDTNYDFTQLSGTLSFDPGETTKVVRIDLNDAARGENDGNYDQQPERFKFVLSDPSNATLAGEGYGWVTLISNDTLLDNPELHVRDAIVDETAGEARFVVTLGRLEGQAANNPVTVRYATADATAKAGVDYTATSGVLTFLPGESVKTVTVPVARDGLAERLETFRFELSDASTGLIGDGRAAALIASGTAGSVAQPTLSTMPTFASEADGFVDVMVWLDAASTATVKVNYATQAGQATTQDFKPLSGTLTFLPGEVMKTVRIDVFGDDDVEGMEEFRLVLSSPANALLPAANASARIGILDAQIGSAKAYVNGAGNDEYHVTSADDMIIELPYFGGRDTVHASLDYTLPDFVETLVLAHPTVLQGTGNAQDNQFVGNASNNRIDGKAGIDTMVYAGPRAAYAVSGSGDGRTVTGAGDGTDTLVSVERLRFADTVLASDTSPGGQAYAVYALLNAAFDAAPSKAELSRWTAELALLEGDTLGLAQQIINHYAPGVGNDALVAHLWATVVEAPLSATDLAAFVALIDNGTYSQASLYEMAAMHALNTAEMAAVVGTVVELDPGYFAALGM